MFSQTVPGLTSRQSWCISSDSVVYWSKEGKRWYTDESGQKPINCVLRQESSFKLASEVFFSVFENSIED